MLVLWYLVIFVAMVESDGSRTVRGETLEIFYPPNGQKACHMKKDYIDAEMKKAYPDDVDFYLACIERKTFPVTHKEAS